MERYEVIRLAKRAGWKKRGEFRRYGPLWFECYRRSNQCIWIGFSDVRGAPSHHAPRGGLIKPPLEYVFASEAKVTLWLAPESDNKELIQRIKRGPKTRLRLHRAS